MFAVFVPLALVTGVVVGAPVPFLALAVAGAIVIIPLGYGYVGLVMLLRALKRTSEAQRGTGSRD